jgi:hypothetical protein
MDITQKLQDFQLSFDAYLEFTDADSFYALKVEFDEFYDEHEHNFDQLQEALWYAVDMLADGAETYWEPIAQHEELEQEMEERRYEGARHLS